MTMRLTALQNGREKGRSTYRNKGVPSQCKATLPAKEVSFEVIEDVLNLLLVGVILLDRDGRALYRNMAAADIISSVQTKA